MKKLRMLMAMVTVVVVVMGYSVTAEAKEFQEYREYVNQWVYTDGAWYFYDSEGGIATNQYIDGYWVGADGKYDDRYDACWKQDAIGGWYQAKNGWYPVNQNLTIDGVVYWFDCNGYNKGYTVTSALYNAETDELLSGHDNKYIVFDASSNGCPAGDPIKVYVEDNNGALIYGYLR